MKKKLAIVLAVAMMTGVIAGCGSKDNSGSASSGGATSNGDAAATSDEEITIKVGHGLPETMPIHQAWVKFQEDLAAKTDGRIKVEIYPNQMLGGDRELIEATQMGNIQATSPSSTPYANFVPEYYLWDVPFLFENRDQVREFFKNEEIAEAFNEKSLAIGIRIIGVCENGFRNVSRNGDGVTPDQYKGLKIRTMENDLHMAAWKAIGANPTPMAFGEVYTALQQKTIDAQENPFGQIWDNKFYEVQDTIIETKHVYTPYIMMMNEAFFQSLSADDQKLILDTMAEVCEYQIDLSEEKEAEYRTNLEGQRTVSQLTDEQRAAFVAKIEEADIKGMATEKSGNPELAEKFFAAVDAVTAK